MIFENFFPNMDYAYRNSFMYGMCVREREHICEYASVGACVYSGLCWRNLESNWECR